MLGVSFVEVDSKEGYATAVAQAKVDLTLMAARWNHFDDRLEHDWDEAHDHPAELQVSATRVSNDDGGGWLVEVDHVVVA